VQSEETKALVGGEVRMTVDLLQVTSSKNLSQRKKKKKIGIPHVPAS